MNANIKQNRQENANLLHEAYDRKKYVSEKWFSDIGSFSLTG
ncbi:hypothetical protein NC99_45500 [Sunxiuqinia dokdonensis]|uniref:Uncharacterized protein n=1 Tax=Sunxiuqinia dokdonensis TaxID=1409788 RepID=A0A0L8V384_9BACT|nr:hypothetical protein NC99_45500 [Sunxiuqinia dokdonensis]